MLLLLACIDYIPRALDEPEAPPQVECCPETEEPDPIDTQVEVEACALSPAEASSVPADPECAWLAELHQPFDLSVELEVATGGSGVGVMPAVGLFTPDAMPDLAFTTWVSNRLYVVRGDTGAPAFIRTGFSGLAGVALADATGDGRLDLVAISTNDEAVLLGPDGEDIWRSAPLDISPYATPTVADLDGDGLPEVVVDRVVLSGQDGTLSSVLDHPLPLSRSPLTVDLDLDGTLEVLLGDLVFAPDGSVLWQAPVQGSSVFAVPVQADSDPELEVAFVSQGELALLEPDGTLILLRSLPGGHPGPPCVGDFDGDGLGELAVPATDTLSLFELDGTLLWTRPVDDASGLAGCSGFDFDRDGADEVVFADHHSVHLLDGQGNTLARFPDHHSFTVWELPVIADVDADGHAEICVAENNGDFLGVRCLGHAGGAWPGSGQHWGLHDQQQPGRVRSRPIDEDPAAPDLVGQILEVCVADCDGGPAQVALQVWNQGAVQPPLGASWSLWQDQSLLSTGLLGVMPPGEASAGVVVDLTVEELGSGPLTLVIEGVVGECDVQNNRVDFFDIPCP